MSSKLITSATATYSQNDSQFDDAGGGYATLDSWVSSGATAVTAVTDDSDSTWWFRQRPNPDEVNISIYGFITPSEDLTSQVPWNSTINSFGVGYRVYRSGSNGTGMSVRPYVRTIGSGLQPTDWGTSVSLTMTTPTDLSSTFTVTPDAVPWTLAAIYGDTYIGLMAKMATGTGGASTVLTKLWGILSFTLPAPTLTNGTATPGASSAQMGVTANANHTFSTAGTDGYPVTVSVEWGLTTAYGNTQQLSNSVIGNSNTALSTTIMGLSTGVTYHYRFKAVDGDNTVYTTDATFTTTSGEPVLMSY